MEVFFETYLDRLDALHKDIKVAIEGLPQAGLDWVPGEDIPSICILVTHLTGAERYWIGDVACQDPSDRNRAAEFEARGLEAANLESRLDQSLRFAGDALAGLKLVDLKEARTSPRDDRKFTAGWALAHALEHTALHLGHAQVTRQLWEHQND